MISSCLRLGQLFPKEHVEVLGLLRAHMNNSIKGSAYNWIRPSLWTALFGKMSTTGKHASIKSLM
jgi:hypothetical protein